MTLKIKEYFAQAGSQFTNADARVIGPVLAELSHAGEATEQAVVDAARSENCPMHAYFEWDDGVAANEYRKGQAKQIIHSIRVRAVSDGKERSIRAYKVARTFSQPSRAVIPLPPETLFRDQDLNEIACAALRELQTWRLKYRWLYTDLMPFNDAVMPLINQIKEFEEELSQQVAELPDLNQAIERLSSCVGDILQAASLTGSIKEQTQYLLEAIKDAEEQFEYCELPFVVTENEALRMQLDDLTAQSEADALVGYMGLTASEAKVLSLILHRDLTTKQSLHQCLYGVCDPNTNPKIVDVFVCKVRRKLKQIDVEIETIWGIGFRMSAEMKARLREQLQHEMEAA